MEKKLRHFSELRGPEVEEMMNRCIRAATSYAQEIGMSRLAEEGSHNIYMALDYAIFSEYERARRRNYDYEKRADNE